MAELSDRLAELMARMARNDADLFRTLGEQNAAVRQLVDQVTLAPQAAHPAASATASLPPACCRIRSATPRP